MDWASLLRAAVPLGAAVLSFIAYRAAMRQRSGARDVRDVSEAMPQAATRARVEPPASDVSRPSNDGAVVRRLGARTVAAAGLVLLMLGTAVVVVASRPLADVDIANASARRAPCSPGQICPPNSVLSVSGTLGGSDPEENVDQLYLLVKPTSGEAWSVGAQTRPGRHGDWAVTGVVVPAGPEKTIDVRAVAVPRERAESRLDPRRVESLPRSRVVRLAIRAGGIGLDGGVGEEGDGAR